MSGASGVSGANGHLKRPVRTVLLSPSGRSVGGPECREVANGAN